MCSRPCPSDAIQRSRSVLQRAIGHHAALGSRCAATSRDPAVLSRTAADLQALLGLSEEELLQTLDADPLAVLAGELDHRPELPILVDLLAEAEERAGAPVLHRWVRAEGPSGRPLDQLLRRDFGAFEDALATLAERGFVIRGGGTR